MWLVIEDVADGIFDINSGVVAYCYFLFGKKCDPGK